MLADDALSTQVIDRVLDSGYFMRNWIDPFTGRISTTVSDLMYGNKQFSSSFAYDDFLAYVSGARPFQALPPFKIYTVRNRTEIEEILTEPRRSRYREEGTLSLRGQPKQYKFLRKLPNPVRADATDLKYLLCLDFIDKTERDDKFANEPEEKQTIRQLLFALEPNDEELQLNGTYSYDVMRTEQHYATQTAGLDLSYKTETAIFFATNKFKFDEFGHAYYEPVSHGQHEGVIYAFKFCDPPVKGHSF